MGGIKLLVNRKTRAGPGFWRRGIGACALGTQPARRRALGAEATALVVLAEGAGHAV